MDLGISSWAEFKEICIVRKNLNCQYVDRGSSYTLIGPDAGGITWILAEFSKLPEDPDCVDFEENYKPSFNWAIGQKASAFAAADFEFSPISVSGICAAGRSESILIPMDGKKLMSGGRFVTDGNAVFGDCVDVDIVDDRNSVLKNWMRKWLIDWKSCSELIETPYAGLSGAGTYLRLTYHSIGEYNVGFGLNLLLHRKI